MILLKNNKGQLLVYFLIVSSLIALAWASVMQFQMQEIKRNLRMVIVSELKAECSGNMAQCKIAVTDRYVQQQTGDEPENKPVIRTKSLKKFIKVAFSMFNFTKESKARWLGLQNDINDYVIIKEDNNTSEFDPRNGEYIYNAYYELNLFLIKAQSRNYNFNF